MTIKLIGMEGRRLLRKQRERETTGSSRARGKRPTRNGNQPAYYDEDFKLREGH